MTATPLTWPWLRDALARLPRPVRRLEDHAPACRDRARLLALEDRDRDDVLGDLDEHAEHLLVTRDIPCICST